MKRIIRISGLRSCGVFRDFTWPSDLPEFGQYNVIYGWNGTGKTTLSRLLRDLELRRAPTVGAAVLRIDGSDVPGTDFPRSTLQVRVFNRDFIHQNVFPVEHSDLPPILVLGAEYVGRQKEVERLKKRAATARSELEYSRSAEERAGRDFDRFLADRARVIKDTLRTSGRSQYNNYNKAGFHGDAEEMAKAGSSTTHGLTAEECERLHARHRATPKARVAEVVYAMPDLKVIGDRVAEILTETVVSAAIGALKGDPRLADWSREGLTLHRDRRAERCLFCEQPLPADRVAALEAHFSAA